MLSLLVEGFMRILGRIVVMFALIMGAVLLAKQFDLAIWYAAIPVAVVAALLVEIERMMFKAWDRWRATHQANKE
jgi:hypothetical protein